MRTLSERLQVVEKHVNGGKIKVMIIGLGSVGSYLLDYLISLNDPSINVIVVGRNESKLETKVNIVRIAGLIRGVNKSRILIESDVDLNDIDSVSRAIEMHKPDFIVNSSRAYSGLKYGSISWVNVRAYGIWSPLAIKYTKNVMKACDDADTDAVVINTSYSDAVIPWLKSAGQAYPDFGSGNLNHLIPRIKFAVADMLNIDDFWNIKVAFAAGHFHDVCISKEGQTEGIELPLKIFYNGNKLDLPHKDIFAACSIAMPVDQTRNMMNASSNFEIINSIIQVIRNKDSRTVYSPGFGGNIGGYPVKIGYYDEKLDARIDESEFSFEEMNKANRESMALDGIEDVKDGDLIYTDTLIEKAKAAFGTVLPKTVPYSRIEETANYIIDNIITPQLEKQ